VGAADFGDEGVSPEQAEFAADPGGVTADLLFVVGSLGKEEGAEIAIAETVKGELTVVDGGQQCAVVTQPRRGTRMLPSRASSRTRTPS